MTFQLDTSGHVDAMASRSGGPIYLQALRWSDLSPFEQGYTRGAFAELHRHLEEAGWNVPRVPLPAFSKLAPETLAAIRKDCAAFGQTWRMQEPERGFAQGEQGGRDFWMMRQRGALTDPPFPPLTITLGDDGRVYLRGAAQ